LHISGGPAKFREALRWKEVDFYLSRGGGNLSRVTIDDGPARVPESSYVRIGISGTPYIRASELTALAASGAVVTVDAAAEAFAGVAELTDLVSEMLEVPVSVAAKLSWCRSAAVHPQKQETDTLVVQPCGEVEWWAHRPVPVCPPMLDPETAEMPPGGPQWHPTALKQGDCLYVPRGGWYCCRSVNQASITLVLSFSAPTAIDILGRIVDRLRRFPNMHLEQELWIGQGAFFF